MFPARRRIEPLVFPLPEKRAGANEIRASLSPNMNSIGVANPMPMSFFFLTERGSL